jgi:predicted RNase H-like HicB family nuclease
VSVRFLIEATNMKTFTSYVERNPEPGLYVGIVPGISGAHTWGSSLDELRKNLRDVMELCLEAFDGPTDDLPRFVEFRTISPYRGAS